METLKTLEAVLDQLAADDQGPWHLVLPAAHTFVNERSWEVPVTLIFRREEPPTG